MLHDGSTTHVRPMLPTDADALQAFHVAQSERSTYLRFFAAMERLSERDLQRLVTVDHVDRVALVAVADVGGTEQIIGVARYDRIDDDDAEVAFNVADAHQGRGLGSVLLEHLAAAARERGVRRFVAEVLPQNGRMISVFREAGYVVQQRTEDGIVALSFDIDPTDRSLAVMADREHRAEARSVRQLLEARSVVVVGPGRRRRVARSDGSRRPSWATCAPATRTSWSTPSASRALPRCALVDVLGPVELAVVAVPSDEAVGVVRDLAPLGVRGVVLLSAGFAEDGPEGLERQRELLRVAHGSGMRVVGPGSYGLLAHRAGSLLNASLAQVPPRRGQDRAVLPVGARWRWRCSRRSVGAGSACPSSSPPGIARTSRATTSCSSGPTTTAPTSWGCTSSRSATRASSPGWPGGCRSSSRWSS